MEKQAMNLLKQIYDIKNKLNELETEDRKVCECNERLPYSPNDFKSNIRMYKACDYHSARKVKGISYA